MEELIIEPGRTERNYWKDLWRFRELLYFLAYRDILVRYKQTVLGVAWALLRPALTTLVFVAYRGMTKMPSAGVPDAIFVYAALIPWQFFSNSLTESSASLIGNTNLIAKVYFPRLLIPAGSVVTSLVDFAITIGLLGALMAWYRFTPDWHMLFLIPLTVLTFALSCGTGLLLSALTVEYRDFRYIVPFIVQFGLFVSPIAFTASSVPEKWRVVFALNPMAGIIDGFRWAILRGQKPLDPVTFGISIGITVLFLWFGIVYFRSTERRFADVI